MNLPGMLHDARGAPALKQLPVAVIGKFAGGDPGGLLARFFDAGKDGSVLDDLMGMAGKFLLPAR
jgi:hypothetical protein